MDIITPILSVVSLLCNCSGNNRCRNLCDLRENKNALKTAMEELKDARDDVKRRVDEAENNPNEPMKCNQEVSGWLQRVQDMEGEVVKVIQKTDQEVKGRCIGGYCPKNCWSANKVGKQVIRKLAIVNELRSKGSFGDVAYKLPPSSGWKEPVDLTVGMESIFEEVWRSLAEDEVRVMGLYGCGGVGKSTLLKQINNEYLKSTTTTHGFDRVVIFVTVSKALNMDAIRMEIGKRLGLSSPDRTSIFNTLRKKNFVLLLDDIWERVDLQSIGVPRPENKSKIVFTTRTETICGSMESNKMLRVDCLPWDKAWSLFQQKVGERALNSFPRARELAEVVARECGGLPLALIVIGRAMSTKKTVEEWNHAITTLRESKSEFPGMGGDVLPVLKLNYDSLQNDTIKSCFIYCALYPEDHSIYKTKLIDCWIGEGILLNKFDHIDVARNHGYAVIGDLKSACLLESGEDENEVRMHDIIRGLAFWIAFDCGTKTDKMLIINSSDGRPEKWYNAERIYLRCSGEITVVTPPKSPNLLTLIYGYDSSSRHNLYYIPQKFFQFMPLLRVLDLSRSHIETFPSSITKLFELQYLSLSRTHIDVLPKELRKLVKLKYLDLSHMVHLKKIPCGVIGSLLELRFLNLYRCCCRTDWDIEEGYKLKHLNDLGITIHTQHNLNKLLSNQNLQMCTRRLHLLASPSSSTTLALDSMKSLEKFEILSNLEILSLESLPMIMNMEWENHHKAQQHLSSFQNLSEIHISGCNALKNLTWVGYVGNLKKLEVSYCKEIEEIIGVVDGDDGFGGTGTQGGDEIISTRNVVDDVFKSLKTLKMTNLPKLKNICRIALAFPWLEDMHVLGCLQLKKLPFDSGSNFNNTLQSIEGEEEWWNELQWEEEDHKIHNNNNELLKSKFLPYFIECSHSDCFDR